MGVGVDEGCEMRVGGEAEFGVALFVLRIHVHIISTISMYVFKGDGNDEARMKIGVGEGG